MSEATATTNALITEEGVIVFDAEDDSDIWETNEWRCPECEEIIAYNQEGAMKFVNGELNKNETRTKD
jgi:hypothetical protein